MPSVDRMYVKSDTFISSYFYDTLSFRLFDCELTGECCRHFMDSLMSQHCLLSELDLSVNDLDQEGALLLCQALSHPGCPMEKLGWGRK